MGQVPAAAIDVGTMFLQSARDGKGDDIVYNTIRDCYREIEYAEEFEENLRAHGTQYIRDGERLYVLGDDALIQAGMAEFAAAASGAEQEMLKRPMRDGILNPDSPKTSMVILKELLRVCLEKDVGKARPGEILYYSVPANPVDSQLDNQFHSSTIGRFLNGMGFDARPLSEALAVVLAENPKMYSPEGEIGFTGIGISMGAGQCNFCLAEKGSPLMEFSVARSGDWIDSNVARATGSSRTRVLRVKEKKLNFDQIDQTDEILLALEVYYESLINYVFGIFATKFGSNKGGIDFPIDVILSGGTACPPGFDKRLKWLLDKMVLPFKIHEVRLAKDMLRTVAKGCYAKAKRAALVQAKKGAK